jgi:hypothetical protein
MSMRNYAVDDYGMLLSREDACKIAKTIIPPQEWAEEDWESADLYEYMDRLGMITCTCSFEGEAIPINENGQEDWENSKSYGSRVEEEIYYIPLEKYPSLFNQAYKSLDEAKQEISEQINGALDVTIYHIVGTYFG